MFTTLETFDTKFSADSIEWCPIDGYHDLFVCGTYELTNDDDVENECDIKLDEKRQKRMGKIYLFRIISHGKLKLLHELNVNGILDMKWSHVKCQNNIVLGVVNSIGYLQIYKLIINNNDNEKIELIIEKKLRDINDEILALSLDWNTGINSYYHDNINDNDNIKIIVSDSKGWITLFHFNNNDLNIIESNNIHDYEAWIVAFDYSNTNIIYSGGDDCKFHRFDTRMGLISIGCNSIHDAGVTSLHSNAFDEYCLASGSYDEILRLWDTRNFRRPISQINLSGGIWRLKWDPFYGKYLFSACMYGGFKLIDCNNKELPMIIDEYNEHKSIAYGCDWSYLSCDKIINNNLLSDIHKNNIITATCSFYDHTLKLSAININNT